MSEKKAHNKKEKLKSTHKTHVEDTLGKQNMEFPVSVHNLCLGMSCWLKKNKKQNPKNKKLMIPCQLGQKSKSKTEMSCCSYRQFMRNCKQGKRLCFVTYVLRRTAALSDSGPSQFQAYRDFLTRSSNLLHRYCVSHSN